MKRRKFVQYTGAAAAGLVSLSIAGRSFAEEPVRVGIIGTGDRGTGILKLINEIEGMQVTACCDLIPERLDNAISTVSGKAVAYKDYRALLDDNSLDAVVISVPYKLHAQMALDALDAGRHVYCEKTMVHDFEATKKLVEKVESRPGQTFQVGYQYHNSRLYQKVAEIIQNGYCGEVLGIDCQWNRNADWRRPVSDPKWEKMVNWRMYREYSGGLTAELCSHQLDFVNWITGAHPEKVTGFGGIDYWKDGRETYDNVRLFYEYPGGLKTSFTCLTTNSFGDYRIRVMGKKATIDLSYASAKMYIEPTEARELGEVDGVSGATIKAWEKGEPVSLDVKHEEPTKQALIDFQRCIFNNEEPVSNVYSGGRAAVAVRMGINAMDTESVQYWQDDYNILMGG
jgi:predicted dehydrogenase